MNVPEQKISREELHRLVWTRTFVKLAKELGYNHPELAAICEDLNIPRPSGGYWNRLELGTAEDQVPLPPAPPGMPTEIPRGSHKASEKPAIEPPESQVPSAKPEKNKSVADGKIEARPDAAAEKLEARLQPSIPGHDEAPISELDPALFEPLRITRSELYQKVWRITLAAR